MENISEEPFLVLKTAFLHRVYSITLLLIGSQNIGLLLLTIRCIYIKKVVLELLINMVSQMKNTARVKVAHTLGGQDVVIGKVEGVGLEIKVIFLIKERGTAEFIF